jgi:anthranilate/para-aminobenzoate synthase component I
MDTMTDDANDANDENDDWMDNFPPTFISDEFAMNSDQLKRRMIPLCSSANLVVRQAMTDYNERNKSEYDISIDSNRFADAIKGLKEMVREGDAQIVVYQCKGNGAACPCE